MGTAELIELVTSNHAAVVANHEKTQKALADLPGLKASMTNLEQKMARGGLHGGAAASAESWGETIVKSPEFKAFVDGGARGQQRLEIKAAVTIGSGATLGGPLISPHVITTPTMLPKRRLTIRNLLAPGTTTSNSVWFAQQTARQNNAATVSESAPKPQSDMHFVQKQSPVVTIATYVQASRQALDDAQALMSVIDSDLRYNLGIVEEGEMLSADGTGSHLLGLIPQSTAYSAPYVFGAGETNIDRIALAILQSELTNMPANGVCINPIDWMKMRLQKTTQGEYILGAPDKSTPPVIWGLPVVATPAITAGSFLVGSFDLAAQYFERLAVEILISTEHNVNFTTNEVTIRAEERIALCVKQPLALITGAMV
jgi:HK97 family phage major capsid protein